MKQSLLRYFGQKRATHKEDLQKASEPYEAYNLTYLAIAAKILKRRSKKLRAKLGIIAYTKDIKTNTKVSELVPILYSAERDRIQEVYDKIEKPKEQLKKMKEINVNSNRFSLGFNINNYAEKYTVSIYGKDYYQYLSKIQRVSKHKKIEDLPADKLIKIRHLRDIQEEQYTLRLEITIRGWEQIHTKTFYKYLDQIERAIRRVDLALSSINYQNCKICKTPLNQLMKIYPRPYHVKKAISKTADSFKQKIVTELMEKNQTINFDKIEGEKYDYLGTLLYCMHCKTISKQILQTKAESIQTIKTDHNKEMRNIEKRLEIEIEEVLQDYKQKEKRLKFNSKDPPD